VSHTNEVESPIQTDAPFASNFQFVCRSHAKKIQVAASCLPRFDRWQFDASLKQNGKSNRSKDILSRTYIDYKEPFMEGHRVFSTYTPAILPEEVSDIVLSNQKSRELLLRMFPRLVSDGKQRKKAGLYALVIHQHFRIGLPASQISAGLDPRDFSFDFNDSEDPTDLRAYLDFENNPEDPEEYEKRLRAFDQTRVTEDRITDVIGNIHKAIARFNDPPKRRGRRKKVTPVTSPADGPVQEFTLDQPVSQPEGELPVAA
jgi:hypothetical protein